MTFIIFILQSSTTQVLRNLGFPQKDIVLGVGGHGDILIKLQLVHLALQPPRKCSATLGFLRRISYSELEVTETFLSRCSWYILRCAGDFIC